MGFDTRDTSCELALRGGEQTGLRGMFLRPLRHSIIVE